MAGPEGKLKWNDKSKPITLERVAISAATEINPTIPAAQKRAAVAGRIIIPTAIRVPRAWKPATRLITTNAKNKKCVIALNRLIDLKN